MKIPLKRTGVATENVFVGGEVSTEVAGERGPLMGDWPLKGTHMSNDFLPSTDDGLLAWSLNFKTLIVASAVTYGLTTTQATTYTGLHNLYAADLALCDPGVRNKAAVLAKNQSRANLKSGARLLSKIIQGQATVTDSQKAELGLNVKATPSPIGPPPDAPAMDIKEVLGHIVTVRLHDANNAGKRGKPEFCNGAVVFSYVGAVAPTDPALYKFEGNTTKTVFTVQFPSTLAPGTNVFITAMWFNERAQSGPACTPIAATLQFGGVPLAA